MSRVFGVTMKLVKLILGDTTPIITKWITNLIMVMYKVDEWFDEANLPFLEAICFGVIGVRAKVG
jgi:hypothetical protein